MKEIEVTVIGIGAVGSVLATELVKTGGFSLTLLDKQYTKARTLAGHLHAKAIRNLEQVSLSRGIILLSVPDRQISNVARQLATLDLTWGNLSVLHTSGSLSAKELLCLADRGAGTASCHPYQTFPKSAKKPNLQDVTFGIDGNPRGIAAARKIAKALGGRPLIVPPERRTLYHLSAVLASGCIATDLWMAAHILQSLDMTEKQALKTLLPITLRTVFNTINTGARAAVTGPAVRKDKKTINLHLRALQKEFPEMVKAYREMTKVMSSLSDKANKIKK